MRQVFTKDYFKSLPQECGIRRAGSHFYCWIASIGFDTARTNSGESLKVDGTSELPDISMIAQGLAKPRTGKVFPQCMEELPVERLESLGRQYIEQTRRHREGAPFFTDKMPNNFAYVGFIKAILPNAKIIDARRHPMDSCFGCFKQHFAKGQTFTYDLFELGEFYLEYERLMRHWDEALLRERVAGSIRGRR